MSDPLSAALSAIIILLLGIGWELSSIKAEIKRR